MSQLVEEYALTLPAGSRMVLVALCDVIASSDERVRESIKWNAPSYAIDEHFATTGIERDGRVRLVLHAGATKRVLPLALNIDDPQGILDWKSPDRAIARFATAEQVEETSRYLRSILTQWIAQTQTGR